MTRRCSSTTLLAVVWTLFSHSVVIEVKSHKSISKVTTTTRTVTTETKEQVTVDSTVLPEFENTPPLEDLQRYRQRTPQAPASQPHQRKDIYYPTGFQYTQAAAVRVFRGDNFQGDSEVLFLNDGEECLTLPQQWMMKVGSVDTLGLCVLLWESEGCNGNHRLIRGDDENKPGASRLRLDAFQLNSLELC